MFVYQIYKANIIKSKLIFKKIEKMKSAELV